MLGWLLVRLRYAVVLFWAMAALAAYFYLPPLGSTTTSSLSDVVPESAPAARAQSQAEDLSGPVEAAKLIILDQGAYEAEQSVLVVQALHHGNAHREQVCAIMTGLGIPPPDLQAWTYAEATGHARERT